MSIRGLFLHVQNIKNESFEGHKMSCRTFILLQSSIFFNFIKRKIILKKCLKNVHPSLLSCETVEKFNSGDSAAILTAIWLRHHTKKCPRCNASIENLDGRPQITCICRYTFTWLSI